MLKIHFTLILITVMVTYSTSQPENIVTNGGFQLPTVGKQGQLLNGQHHHWKYRNIRIVQVRQVNKRWPDQSTQVLLVNSQTSAATRPNIQLSKGQYTLELDYSATQNSNLTTDCKILIMVGLSNASYETNLQASSYDVQHLKTNFSAKDQRNYFYISDLGKCSDASVIVDNIVIHKIDQRSENLIINGNFEANQVTGRTKTILIQGWFSYGRVFTDKSYIDQTYDWQSTNRVVNPVSKYLYQIVNISQADLYLIAIDYRLLAINLSDEPSMKIYIDRGYKQIFSKQSMVIKHEQFTTQVSKANHVFVIEFADWAKRYFLIDNVVLKKYKA